MHYRYSSILYIVYSALINGIAMPLLFPITMIGLIIVYVQEKMLFVWYYRKPPMYDSKLNDQAIKMLKFAPIFMVL